jgi:hypothetical protein
MGKIVHQFYLRTPHTHTHTPSHTHPRSSLLNPLPTPFYPTQVSVDAPAWFNQDLKAPQPRTTRPFAKYRLGALKRVVLKPLVEVDPYNPSAQAEPLEPPATRPGYIPTLAERTMRAVDPRDVPARLGVTTSADFGAGDYDAAARNARLAPRDRYGKTSAADVGRAEGVAVLAPQAAGATLGGRDGAQPERLHHATARYGDEPPFAAYYAAKRTEMPDGSATVKALRTGPAGHLLWHAEVNAYGTAPAQHLGGTVRGLYSRGAPDATLRLTHTTVAAADPGRFIKPVAMRQAPFNWYNAAR